MAVKNSVVATRKMAAGRRSAVSSSKHPAGKKSAAKKNAKVSASGRPKKGRRHSAAFSTLSSRQQAVERAKLQIWRHLEEINGAVIKLAESGSYLAARTLFDFAGVYTLSPLEQEGAAGAVPAEPVAVPEPPDDRVEAFRKTLGLDQLSEDEAEPDAA